MRIALLSFEYPPDTGFGGIGTYTWFHARALARLGHEVHVVAGASTPMHMHRADHDGVHVWRHRGSGTRDRALALLEHRRWWWSRERARNAIDMFAAMRILERSMTFDVIEMPECGAEGLLVNRLTHAPTIVRLHSPAQLIMSYYDVPPGDVRLCSWLERVAMRGAGVCSSSSHFLADRVRKAGLWTGPIDVLHNGIDLDWFDAAETTDTRAQYGIATDRPMVLFVGRLEPRKGITHCARIIDGVLAQQDASFVFAGDDLFGHMAREIMPALAHHPRRRAVHALGRLPATAVRALLRQADVVFLPSVWESCPYSCLEAMAAGRAIVASDAGGFPELLQHGENGVVVPTANVDGFVDGFVDGLSAALSDAPLRARLGAAARATVEQSFRDTDVAALAVELYARSGR